MPTSLPASLPHSGALALAVALALTATACGESSVTPAETEEELPPASAATCVIDGEAPRSGGPGKDGIPALSDPAFVAADAPEAGYVRDDDRVMGLFWGGEWVALPLNVMRWHEIVNLTGTDGELAVTYCPLTGTGMGFDRSAAGGAEFGVSGLLWRNNVVMYDRSDGESFWVQMNSQAECGPATGTVLPQVEVAEMTWAGWKSLHPETKVVSDETGWNRDYTRNPYLRYEHPDAPPLFDVTDDDRRKPKERVLGIPHPDGSGSVAVPFGVLGEASLAVLELDLPADTPSGTRPVVVFWDRERQAAEAFLPEPEWSVDPGSTDAPRFEVRDGGFVDLLTGSRWTVDGRAVDGPAADSRLREAPESLVAFWFAWTTFNPGTDLITVLD